MNESILNLILKDVIAAYRDNRDCDVKLCFNEPAFDRLICIARKNELDIFNNKFLGIPYKIEEGQKELYRVDVTH